MQTWRLSSRELSSEPVEKQPRDPTPTAPGSGPTCRAEAGSCTKAKRSELYPDRLASGARIPVAVEGRAGRPAPPWEVRCPFVSAGLLLSLGECLGSRQS